MSNEWIPITMETPLPELPCLLCDIDELVYVGYTARDFYDLENVKYYFPIPKFPFPVQGFASEEAFNAIVRTLDKDKK